MCIPTMSRTEHTGAHFNCLFPETVKMNEHVALIRNRSNCITSTVNISGSSSEFVPDSISRTQKCLISYQLSALSHKNSLSVHQVHVTHFDVLSTLKWLPA